MKIKLVTHGALVSLIQEPRYAPNYSTALLMAHRSLVCSMKRLCSTDKPGSEMYTCGSRTRKTAGVSTVIHCCLEA